MGFNKYQWAFLNECFKKVGLINKDRILPIYGTIIKEENYYNKKMLELGCQEIKKPLKKRLLNDSSKQKLSSRKYFKSIGINCTSVDIKACFGSLKIDLRKAMKKIFYNEFDIVTNSGTTEHISPLVGQYNVFKNIHLCTKVNGIMIHILPGIGEYLGHCRTFYRNKFFEKLAEANGYKIALKRIVRKTKGTILIGVCFIKTNNDNFIINKKEFFEHIKWISKKTYLEHKKNKDKYFE